MRYQQSRGGAHRSGTLSSAPLERIEWYFQNYFKEKPVRSVETGCGASTIVFSFYAEDHTVYAYDDRSEENSSTNFALEYPDFRQDRVKWVFGPTQRTLFSHPLSHAVDLVLIDGPHGYPFPEIEYFALYQRLSPGGILILDDVHIPTINNFYKFLMHDDSFRPHGLTMTTAFFQRADRPAFNMEGDEWWLQRYNVQRFPMVDSKQSQQGLRVPFDISFKGMRKSGEPLLVRGFSLLEAPPVSEGDVSNIEVRIDPSTPKRVKLRLDIEPVCVEDGIAHLQEPGFSVLVDSTEVGRWHFGDSRRRTIEIEADTRGGDTLHVEFWYRGLLNGNHLQNWIKCASYDWRLPNFRLHGLGIAEAGSERGHANVIDRVDGSVLSFDYGGQRFHFLADEPHDLIQSFHAAGRFYEIAELEGIRTAVGKGANILDVGAHVGNHTMFFAKLMEARRVVAIEPNPRTQALLRLNCDLNGAGTTVDLSHLGLALGAAQGRGHIMAPERYDSGRSVITVDADGPVNIVTGDALFPQESFDVVKIDVGGMEIEVLTGLRQLIARCTPILLVSARSENGTALTDLLGRWGYAVSSHYQDCADRPKYLLTHRQSSQARLGLREALNRLIGRE